MKIETQKNYVCLDYSCLDPSAEKIAFVTRFDAKYVYGILWSYITSRKSGFRMRRDKFESRYELSPQEML